MWVNELIELLGEDKVVISQAGRERISKDYYWYSPVIYEQLKEKVAECGVIPQTIAEVTSIVAFAAKKRIPVTVRGAGTGNYGQAIPLQGGIVLDVSKLDKIMEISDKIAQVQAGVKLGVLEKTLRNQGKELRIFPSTYLKATVGGFLCGGSGGIGSIRWGNLWDGNIHSLTVMTMEEEPKIFTVEGEAMQPYLHNYGTAGIVVAAALYIEPKVEWTQSIVSFDDFKEAVKFSDELAHNEGITKRLVSVCEWPIPTHFQPLKPHLQDEKSIVMLEIEDGAEEKLAEIARKYAGNISFTIPAEKYQKGLKLSDFTWNHATLWAHKHGDNITYLQARFDKNKIFEQMDAIREKFGFEVQFHFEYIKIQGEITPASLPVLTYHNEYRLNEIIAFFESVGVMINNPHTYLLGFGGYNLRMEEIEAKKKINDPYGLLNPGKIPQRTEIPQ